MTVFVFRGSVVSRYHCRLSAFTVQYLRSQLADYYGAYYDSDITVFQY